MYFFFCFVQDTKGKTLLNPGLGALQSAVKNTTNGSKTHFPILGLEHPSLK
jgi:hypothetical protein